MSTDRNNRGPNNSGWDRSDERLTLEPSDPLSIFSGLGEVEVSAEEVEEMQRQVVALASWEDTSTLSGQNEEPAPFAEKKPRPWAFVVAAAVILSAGLVVGLGSIGVGPFAGVEGDDSVTVAEEISQEMEHLLAVLPLVEDLDPSPSRVTYQLDEGDLDFVMVVDEGLDL